MARFRLVLKELAEHSPFTALGAVTGIIVMVILVFTRAPQSLSDNIFYTLHPLHVLFSALVTTAIYRRWGGRKIWYVILIGYSGSVGIGTLSDAIIPFLGGTAMKIEMHLHVPFIETEKMPFLGIAKWQVINLAAFLGMAIGYFKPKTKFPHAGHVLLSTWASLFNFTAFGVAEWIPLLHFVFLFLFLSVWIPCCLSDIVYPLLFVNRKGTHLEHAH